MILDALADASSSLLGLGRPLARVQRPAPSIPQMSRVPGQLDRSVAWAENVRVRSAIAYDDAGAAFTLGRIHSEKYPLPACSISDIRDVAARTPRETLAAPLTPNIQYAPYVFGAPTRLLGREPRMSSSF